MSSLIFKIVAKQAWAEAVASGCFKGAVIDLADGFIHLSNAAQAEETAARHFAGQTDLLLVAFDPNTFGTALIWEVSRGGALFPHVYGTLDPLEALWAKPLVWNGASHVFPEEWKG